MSQIFYIGSNCGRVSISSTSGGNLTWVKCTISTYASYSSWDANKNTQMRLSHYCLMHKVDTKKINLCEKCVSSRCVGIKLS